MTGLRQDFLMHKSWFGFSTETDNILPKDLKEFSLMLTNGILGLRVGPQTWACCQNHNAHDSFSCRPRIQNRGFWIKTNIFLSFLPLLLIIKISLLEGSSYNAHLSLRKAFGEAFCEQRHWTTLLPRSRKCYLGLCIPTMLTVALPQMANKVNAHSFWPNCRALQSLQWLQNVSNPIPTAPGSEIAIFRTRAEHFTC